MKEFFEINSLIDLLSIIAFVITIVMFIPWLRQHRPFVEKIFNLSSLIHLFNMIGLYWLVQGDLLFAMPSYFLGWIISIIIFFNYQEKKIMDLKFSFFNLLLSSLGVFTLFQLSLINEITESIQENTKMRGAMIDTQTKLISNQETLFQILQNKEPHKIENK